MRNTIVITGSALLLLAGLGGADAAQATNPPSVDAGPVIENSQAMQAADQTGLKTVSIRQQIQNQLTKTGYTDVNIMPSTFLIHAKDKQSNPVAMVIGPDSFTEVTEVVPKTASAAPNTAAPNAPAPNTAAPKATTPKT